MKYLVVKDKKNRKTFSKNELKNLSVKAFFKENFFKNQIWAKDLKDENFPNLIRFYKNRGLFLNTLKKEGSVVKIRNRCIISGRPRSVNRQYKLSRIVLREYISKGLLMGVKKKSW